MRTGLDGLGVEVDQVRNVVEELVREKEAGRQWDAEEEERRESLDREHEALAAGHSHGRSGRSRKTTRHVELQAPRREAEEDPNQTPRPKAKSRQQWTGPETPMTGRSYINRDEINRLQAELARQEAKSPTPRPRRTNTATVQQRVSCVLSIWVACVSMSLTPRCNRFPGQARDPSQPSRSGLDHSSGHRSSPFATARAPCSALAPLLRRFIRRVVYRCARAHPRSTRATFDPGASP